MFYVVKLVEWKIKHTALDLITNMDVTNYWRNYKKWIMKSDIGRLTTEVHIVRSFLFYLYEVAKG